MSKKPTGASLGQAQPSIKGDKSTFEPYETEGHMRTLMDAHEVANNPAKMRAVHKLAGRHTKALSAIKSLRAQDSSDNATKPGFKSIKDLTDFSNNKYGASKRQTNDMDDPQDEDI